MRLNKTAIFYKTCLIPFVIAFFKVFNQPTWIFGTFKTVRQRFFFDTVLYFAFATMLRLSLIAIQATSARFFMVTVLIANLAIHSAWGEHTRINFFFWHFHSCSPLSTTSDLSFSYFLPRCGFGFFSKSDLCFPPPDGSFLPQAIRPIGSIRGIYGVTIGFPSLSSNGVKPAAFPFL